MGTTGTQLNADVSALPTYKAYNWRARTKYNLASNPFQEYGPWKYYTSYQPFAFGSFKSETAPLPVEMAAIAAHTMGNTVELRWTTSTEVDNEGWEIQRSVRGNPQAVDWGRIGFVKGAGTSSGPKRYSFVDANPTPGPYAYRLKQLDRNGTFQYSKEMQIEVGSAPRTFALTQNYPNPFNPSTTIEFTLPSDGRVILKVYDITGREVATLLDQDRKAGVYQQVVFDASRYASGVYFASLQFAGRQLLKKMTLVK